MRLQTVLVTLLGLGFSASTLSQGVDDYIAKEGPIAKANLLANIGPDGSRASGAAAGVVIASPGTENPDYLFTWVRDSCLVFKVIIDQFTSGEDTSLRGLIDEFINAEAALQKIPNRSGGAGGAGLGEPKFNINLTAFIGDWGRPQRDGPALRATAMINYANWLLDNNNSSFVTDTLWPVISMDLTYVSNYWNQTGFDLWEEVSSASFFTSSVQHRALREGSTLASRISQTANVSTYDTQAGNILCFLQSYWNSTGSFTISNTGGGRSGIDANTALSSIHTFDADAGCDDATFQPCSSRALASLKTYVDSFRDVYSINNGLAGNQAVATGRYKEDVYFNGNPWYLTTAVVAEQLYDSIIVWKKQGSIEVTDVSLPFFQQFSQDISAGTYDSNSDTYNTLLNAIQSFADGFIAIVAKYTPEDGSLAEQYGKSDGVPLSAVHLTWSYASVLTAFAARNGTTPKSWGAKGLTVPSVCQPNAGPVVHATFNVNNATTVPGQNVFLTGSVGVLSGWSTDSPIAMSADNYSTWSVTLDIPADAEIEYKYIKKDSAGNVVWLADPNNEFTSPTSGNYTANDTWR